MVAKRAQCEGTQTYDRRGNGVDRLESDLFASALYRSHRSQARKLHDPQFSLSWALLPN